MSKISRDLRDKRWKLTDIGSFQVSINGIDYGIGIAISEYGVRFVTTKTIVIEQVEKKKRYYFGEGEWLNLPSIEEAVIEIFEGSMKDVENVIRQYETLVFPYFSEAATRNALKGFIHSEYQRIIDDEK